MLTVTFGESTINRTQVQMQYNRFKESQEDVNDNARSDCQSTSTTDEKIAAVKKIILDNRRITTRELEEEIMMLTYPSADAKQF